MSAEHKGGHEKKEKMSASKAFEWIKGRTQEASDTAFKFGFVGAGVGLLVDIAATIAGAGPLVCLGRKVFQWGLVIGVGGFIGRLIAGKPHAHGGH